MKRVVRLTERDLTNLIKRIIVEAEMSSMDHEGEMEEGLFGPNKEEREELENDLKNKMEELIGKSEHTMDDLANTMDSILKKAKESKYKGKVTLTKTSKGRPMFKWDPELTMMQKLGAGTRGQTYGR
jgi:hypothetical protein